MNFKLDRNPIAKIFVQIIPRKNSLFYLLLTGEFLHIASAISFIRWLNVR